jgi:hypothetical protein
VSLAFLQFTTGCSPIYLPCSLALPVVIYRFLSVDRVALSVLQWWGTSSMRNWSADSVALAALQWQQEKSASVYMMK